VSTGWPIKRFYQERIRTLSGKVYAEAAQSKKTHQRLALKLQFTLQPKAGKNDAGLSPWKPLRIEGKTSSPFHKRVAKPSLLYYLKSNSLIKRSAF
jgi:hypothetical protein